MLVVAVGLEFPNLGTCSVEPGEPAVPSRLPVRQHGTRGCRECGFGTRAEISDPLLNAARLSNLLRLVEIVWSGPERRIVDGQEMSG